MLNEKEIKLIAHLRKNGREKINKIAQENNIPNSTMADTLRKLNSKGIIKPKTDIAFEKIGYPIKLFIAFKTDIFNREELKKYLEESRNVNNLHKVDGNYDFHTESIFKNYKEANDFTENIESRFNVTDKLVLNIIDTVNKENFLSSEDHYY